MAIVCKECNVGISIAKYYPSPVIGTAGWGQFPLNRDRVNYFFELHSHGLDVGMWGGNQYELRYEIDDNTWKYDPLIGYEEWLKNNDTFSFSAEALEDAEEFF